MHDAAKLYLTNFARKYVDVNTIVLEYAQYTVITSGGKASYIPC